MTSRRLAFAATLPLLCAVLLCGARTGHAQQTTTAYGVILGTVTDTGLRAMASVEVVLILSGGEAVLHTDATGRFRFTEVPPRRYLIAIRQLGFKAVQTTVDVVAGDTLRPSYILPPANQTLGAVTVTGQARSLRMQQFEERQRTGQGEFFTSDLIEKRGAENVADVLRWSKTVRVELGGYLGQQYAMSARPQIPGAPCPMQIFVDGSAFTGLPEAFAPRAPAQTAARAPGFQSSNALADGDPQPVDLSSLMGTKEIAGIEIYGGAATVPVQFNTGVHRSCGVILIWTKDR